MIDKNLKALGFALSNAGLLQDVEAEVRGANPTYDDAKVLKERDKVLKKMTLYNDKNKKPKKAKKVK